VEYKDTFESLVSKSIYMAEDDILVANYMSWSAGVLHMYPDFSKTSTRVREELHVGFF
jgi:hypothetical protein